jgi:signal transduction histidine kinase
MTAREIERMSTWGKIGRPLAAAMISALIAVSAVSSVLIYASYQTSIARLEAFSATNFKDELAQESIHAKNAIEFRLGILEALLKKAGTTDASNLASASDESSHSPTGNIDIDMLDSSGIASVVNVAKINESGIVTRSIGSHPIVSAGNDVSDQRYFELATVQNGTLLETYSQVGNPPYLVLGYPINGHMQQGLQSSDLMFGGELVMFIDPRVLGSEVSDQLTLNQNVDHFLLTGKNGLILFDSRGQLQSQNVHDSAIAAYFTTQSRESISKAFNELLDEGKQGITEYSDADSSKGVISYSPILINDKLVLGTVLSGPFPHPGALAGLLDDVRALLLIGTALIIAAPAIFIFFILIINRRLITTVGTQEGKIAGQYHELQVAYEKLKETDTLKDEFINIASHELRTPVLPIILSAENLADELPDNPKILSILRNAKRISKLTNDILDVSRIESNTFKLQKQQTNVKKLIEDLVQDFSVKIPRGREVAINTDFSKLSPGSESCLVDKSRIIQVLSNLIDNAINFTEDGTITVRAEHVNGTGNANPDSGPGPGPGPDSDSMKISIIDSGIGIDPEVKDRLFGKFVTKSPIARGTGLGLYLSKAIIEAHGGRISAQNNPEGKGALFSFTLPANSPL